MKSLHVRIDVDPPSRMSCAAFLGIDERNLEGGRLYGAALWRPPERPDSISFHNEIVIQAWDGDFLGPGYTVEISGYGYFWPWDVGALRDRVVRSPKLQRLRQAVQERYGGRFVFPATEESMLRERWIDGKSGWLWFASESG